MCIYVVRLLIVMSITMRVMRLRSGKTDTMQGTTTLLANTREDCIIPIHLYDINTSLGSKLNCTFPLQTELSFCMER